MSDRTMGALAGLMLCVGIAGAQAPTVRVQNTGAGAPRSAELRRIIEQADGARVRYDSANARYRRAQRTGSGPRDTAFIIAGPIRLAVTPMVLSDAEVQRMRTGIERAFATLDRLVGPHVFEVVDTTGWFIRGQEGRLGPVKSVVLRWRAFGRRSEMMLNRPLLEDDLESIVLAQAGQQIARALPALGAYAVSFADDRRWEFAGRELSLSYATSGRRCAAGDIVQCRRVLGFAVPGSALETWFTPPDHRAVATAALSQIRSGSPELQASWERCEAGADSACTRIAPLVRVGDPFSNSLRGTFVQHAFETGAPGMIDRMRQDTTSDHVALLANSACVPEDSLVASWQRRVARALEESPTPAFPVVVSTVLWGVVLLGLATRSRPS